MRLHRLLEHKFKCFSPGRALIEQNKGCVAPGSALSSAQLLSSYCLR